jgi:hypothetical protein
MRVSSHLGRLENEAMHILRDGTRRKPRQGANCLETKSVPRMGAAPPTAGALESLQLAAWPGRIPASLSALQRLVRAQRPRQRRRLPGATKARRLFLSEPPRWPSLDHVRQSVRSGPGTKPWTRGYNMKAGVPVPELSQKHSQTDSDSITPGSIRGPLRADRQPNAVRPPAG